MAPYTKRFAPTVKHFFASRCSLSYSQVIVRLFWLKKLIHTGSLSVSSLEK